MTPPARQTHVSKSCVRGTDCITPPRPRSSREIRGLMFSPVYRPAGIGIMCAARVLHMYDVVVGRKKMGEG